MAYRLVKDFITLKICSISKVCNILRFVVVMVVYLFSIQDTRVKDEENIIDRDGAEKVKEEPSLDVLDGNQLRLHDDFITVIALLEACNTQY